jgi:hypothetical protein
MVLVLLWPKRRIERRQPLQSRHESSDYRTAATHAQQLHLSDDHLPIDARGRSSYCAGM